MSISVQRLWERAGRKFGLSASGGAELNDFLDAVNNSLSTMSKRVLTDDESITKPSGTLSLDGAYLPCLLAGIDFYLSDSGYKASSEEGNYYARFVDEMRTAQMHFHHEADTRGKFGEEAD